MKIVIIGLIQIITLGVFARNSLDQNNLTINLPFQSVKLKNESIKIPAKLVIPALVSEEVFVKEIKEDCFRFRDTLQKQEGKLTKEDLHEIQTLPLPYTMKNNYEVLFTVNKNNYLTITEGIKINVTPETSDSLIEADADSLYFKINYRNQLCDFIDKTNKIKFYMQVRAQNIFNTSDDKNIEDNANLNWKILKLEKLAQQMNQLLAVPMNNQLRAIKMGLLLCSFKHNNSEKIEAPFLEVEYLWGWLFKDYNGFVKSNLWKTQSKEEVLGSDFILSSNTNENLSLLNFNQWFKQGVSQFEVEIVL